MLKKSLFLSLLFALLSGACLPTSSAVRSILNCAPREHDIVKNNHFQLLWAKSNIYSIQSESNPMIQGVPPIVFVGVQAKNYQASMIAFDIKKGNDLWKEPLTLPVNILASGDNLYVGTYNKLAVHDPETGNLRKVINLPKVGTIQTIYASDQKIYINTGNGSWVIYDINNDKSEISQPLLPYVPFIIENETLYIIDVDGFKALNANTRSILWKYSISDPVTSHPLFTGDAIIVLTETNNVYVLNKNTGDLLWNKNFPIISNLATDSSYLFFLTQAGSLKIIDIRSGQEIQSLDFSTVPFQVSTSNTIIGGYNIWIDSQDEIIVVSLGDSCQLMALKVDLP